MTLSQKPAESDVLIRPAKLRDVGAVYRLENLCFQADAWPWIDVLATLIFPETVRLKAMRCGDLVGYVVGDRRRHVGLGWIASIGVHPDHRRMGIGRQLLKTCEHELGMPRIRLTLRRSNDHAMNLYLSDGYVPVDTWARYYRDGEDGIVMEKVVSEVQAK